MTARDVIAPELSAELVSLLSEAIGRVEEPDMPAFEFRPHARAALFALLSAPDSVRQELAALLNPWRPIETAPKDGTRFLGYQPHFGVSIIHRHAPGTEAKNPKHHYECWALDNDYGHPCKPTKWLPLPAPPSEDKT